MLAEPARRLLPVDGEERRMLLGALRKRVVAARLEAAALRPVERARHRAADDAELLGLRHAEQRNGLELRLGVRMLRRAEDAAGLPPPAGSPGVHDDRALAHL